MAQTALPTYLNAAGVLEKRNGSGVRLIGYTVMRAMIMGPIVMITGVPARQAFFAAGLTSVLMSTFVLLRIFDERHAGLAGIKRRVPARRASRR